MSLDFSARWVDLPWVVIDFESTHYIPKRAEVVEVAAVRFEGGQVVETFSSGCKPEHPIPEAATAIHGITDAMVAGCPHIADLAPELLAVCQDAVPVAYQAQYDRTLLHRFIADGRCPAFDPTLTWVCPLTIVKDVERVTGGKGWYKLGNVCQRWGIELHDAHRAIGDAEATGQLLWAMYAAGRIRPCTLDQLLRRVDVRMDAHEKMRSW